ncbi:MULTISPECIES: hypothetical protein [unclassified Arsukibacterium]|nr:MULTISPECIES: hypothetical protein [unclassified Arsukibacterium]|tara:strand:+ start:15141 stop:15290 length:150 start_codon:yes stop_codon:yes gene_type:complete
MANQRDQGGRPSMDEEKRQSGANRDQNNQQKPAQQKPGNIPGQSNKPGQ